MQTIKKPFFHITLILLGAVLLNFLPFFVSGIPLQHQLLSDAESRIAFWQIALDPNVFTNDRILQLSLSTLPMSETILSKFFVLIANFLNLDIFVWSVFLSFSALLLFLLGLYILVSYSIQNDFSAFLITFFCIIPVHALGATTFGFQALGFLPRDLALALSMFVLILYFCAIKNKQKGYLSLTFFILGLLTNYYPPLFPNLFLTLILAELIRTKDIDIIIYLKYAILFIIGAFPAVYELFIKNVPHFQIDRELMQSFYRYMIVYPFSFGSLKYLRRFLLYAFLIPLIYYFILKKTQESDLDTLRPWFPIAISSFILTVTGLYIESTTTLVKYFLSRASLWFILSSMIIIVYGLNNLFKKLFPKKSIHWTVAVFSLIFLFQSNLPTTYRFLRTVYEKRYATKEFHYAIAELKELTVKGDVILAPSGEYFDLAASVRTYSFRPIYVCYKYGGVVLLDGTIGRQWLQRYQKLENIFKDHDPIRLINFMKEENIHYAFVPSHYYRKDDLLLKNYIVFVNDYYLIVNVRS